MQYMLDTNTCIAVINGKPEQVRERLLKVSPGDIFISQIVYFELLFGVCNSKQKEKNRRNLAHFLRYIQVLDWTEEQSEVASQVRCDLTAIGKKIGHYDTLIASHALSIDACIVTHNTREFERVNGLKYEDWE